MTDRADRPAVSRALILAAGAGRRLAGGGEARPKCLLEFEGRTLLRRHVEMLHAGGIDEVVVAVGHQASLVEAESARIEASISGVAATCVLNQRYHLGSVLSLWCLRDHLPAGGGVLLMDADVLYDHRLLARLLGSQHTNCVLLDRDLEPGEEPVKMTIRDGLVTDFRKRVEGDYDLVGESVGFFRLGPSAAASLMARAGEYVADGRADQPHEEALRDVMLSDPARFGYEDVTGLPWIEIDFAEDVSRARTQIAPRLQDLPA